MLIFQLMIEGELKERKEGEKREEKKGRGY